jgi:hypothetical protein
MLGVAPVSWGIWKTRNHVCFDKKHINNPIEILLYACAFMTYWTGLYPEATKKAIEAGVNAMLKTTS